MKVDRIVCLMRIAGGCGAVSNYIGKSAGWFGKKTPEEIEKQRLGQIKDLFDESWGRSAHDAPPANDDDILTNSGRYNTETFSSDRQILPDSAIDWLENPGLGRGLLRGVTFGKFPDTRQIGDFAKDPREGVQFFLDHAETLPKSWSEWRKTIEKKLPKNPKYDKFITPITNSMHYAFNDYLTGKKVYDRNAPLSERAAAADEISKRMAYGMRAHMDKNNAERVASSWK